MRTLLKEQLQWRVYEVSTLGVPGAPAARCLIFDSDAIVRRCWSYPASWMTLGDDELLAVMTSQTARRERATTETIATAQSLKSESRLLRDANRTLLAERDVLLKSCNASRDVMLDAVGHYARSLKEAGAGPERAIILIKEAICDGLGGVARCEEPDGAARLGIGVAHAVKVYYAA